VSVKVRSLDLLLFEGLDPILNVRLKTENGLTFRKRANQTASKRAVELLRDLIAEIEKDSLELLQEDFKKGGNDDSH
jgi:hypothetical protein